MRALLPSPGAARRSLLPLTVLAALCFGAHAAHAGTDSDNIAVSATVIASCDITANPLQFNNYDPISATPKDASTTLGLICTNGSGYEIAMNAGNGTGATVAARKMTSGTSDLLTYSIYRDSNRTNVWGSTTGSNTLTGTGTGASQTINVYGRIPINQTATAGSYTDTVVVTVTF